jgi:hypothetical protein
MCNFLQQFITSFLQHVFFYSLESSGAILRAIPAWNTRTLAQTTDERKYVLWPLICLTLFLPSQLRLPLLTDFLAVTVPTLPQHAPKFGTQLAQRGPPVAHQGKARN